MLSFGKIPVVDPTVASALMSGLTEVHTRARTTGLYSTNRAPTPGFDLPLSHHGVFLALEGDYPLSLPPAFSR